MPKVNWYPGCGTQKKEGFKRRKVCLASVAVIFFPFHFSCPFIEILDEYFLTNIGPNIGPNKIFEAYNLHTNNK